MNVKYLLERINNLSSEERTEFNEINTTYNNGAAMLVSVVLAVVLICSTLVGYITYTSGVEGVNEFWLIFPYHIYGIVLSIVAFIVMAIIRKKHMSHHLISDIVALVQICILMAIVLISAHVEIPAIGIKNLSVIIMIMFAFGLFFRFRIITTLIVEVLFTVIAIVFLLFEKNDISNFYPSLINVAGACVAASSTAVMYWNSRKNCFRAKKGLEALVSFDTLTRLHNRRSFDAYFEHEWQHACNENLYVTLFMIDVDHFKKYNDLYGHIEGDKCLATIADSIKSAVRKNDFSARYGGEEFLVSLTGVSHEVAAKVANKMLNAICERNIPHGDSVAPYVTVSIGCMIYRPDKHETFSREDIIKMADAALYMAKKQGRNRFVIHPEAIKV